MYKTDKFSRNCPSSEVQRSKSATNQVQKIQTKIGNIIDKSLQQKGKSVLKKKEKIKKRKIKELKEKRSLGSSKRKRSAGDKLVEKAEKNKQDSITQSDKKKKYSSKDTKNSKRGIKNKKKKKKKEIKSGLKKSSNTNSDKKLKKLMESEKRNTKHKKSFSVNTPSQFKKLIKDFDKGQKNSSKYSRTEKNSVRSKGSSSYVDSKETSYLANSNTRQKQLKTQKSKFSRTENSSESDPKSQISNKKTTHKSNPSKEDSREGEGLQTIKKNLINPTFVSPTHAHKISEKDDSYHRDENFESFAMINENLPGFKFDSFVGPGFSDLKEVLRTTQEERNLRLDKGRKEIFLNQRTDDEECLQNHHGIKNVSEKCQCQSSI